MQGWRKRMEDSHISELDLGNNKDINLFGVFDGHGGKEVAQYVKSHFTEELLNNKNFQSGNYSQSLIDNFFRIDDLISDTTGKQELKKLAKLSKEEDDKNKQNGERDKQMQMFRQLFDPRAQEDADVAMSTGCTANAIIIDATGKKIICANAGDSRAVLCRKGQAVAMSYDHKPDNEIEKDRIYKADGFVSDGRVKGKYSYNILYLIRQLKSEQKSG